MPRDSSWNTAAVLAVRKMLVGRLVVERQRLERRASLAGSSALHVAQRPVEDRERRQAEEVELDQADRLDVVLVELRDDRVRSPACVYSGQKSVSLPGAISTPPACMPTLRVRPSSASASASSSRDLLLVLLALGEQRLHLARLAAA